MWVKICGNTRREDVFDAAAAGADAVGFVFAPSPRQVTAEQVAEISARLPSHVERVGVFAAGRGSGEREAEAVAAQARRAGLTAVQLHNGLDLGFSRRLRAELGPGIGLIHTVHWQLDGGVKAAAEVSRALDEAADLPKGERVLLDAKVGTRSGGLGVAYDWREAATLLRGRGIRLVIAGGLRPETVAEAVRILQPSGVDVSSGVEQAPGHKDRAKVDAFIANARKVG